VKMPSKLGMSGAEAVELYVSSLPKAERLALLANLQKKTAQQIRLEFRDIRAPFAAWMRRARAAVGLTQQSVSNQVGLGRPAYVNYEAGKQSCTFEKFLHLCVVFGCDPVEALREIIR